ncbi:hypothetical protein CSB93_0465 [Pseudomonas paraeruginosa]|uniref:Uncharacterized protein n=1 Tax=Pseudomonas paraeruginosa TaxID=2994495 RepID=A0A2R3IP51_9PSED|nr:hypothetical protein CSB93_0465 [Pseudomonas paraeruginosa]
MGISSYGAEKRYPGILEARGAPLPIQLQATSPVPGQELNSAAQPAPDLRYSE